MPRSKDVPRDTGDSLPVSLSCLNDSGGVVNMCCDGWDYGVPNGECPECGGPTVDGDAATGCLYSPQDCAVCNSAPCDDSC